MSNPMHPRLRVAFAFTTISLSLTALTGCTGGTSPASTPTPKAAAEASASPSPSSTADASPAPTTSPSASAKAPSASPIPVSLTCDQLVSRQAMYDFNANFGLQSDYTPKAGSAAARAVALKGVACSWLNQTSRDTIELSVAHLSAADIATRKAALRSSSTPVSAFGPSGYFKVDDGVGVAEAFSGTFWVVASSTFFSEPSEAAQIVSPAMTRLG